MASTSCLSMVWCGGVRARGGGESKEKDELDHKMRMKAITEP